MRKNTDLPRICYAASPRLFSEGGYGVHAIEMCKAMDRLGAEFEAVLPGRFSPADIFKYYGVKKPFRLKSLPFTKNFGRQILHGIFAAIYAFSNRRRFDIVLTRNILCAAVSARTFGLATVYDAHHPPVNKFAELLFKSFQNSPNLKAVSFNSGGLRDIYLKFGLDENKAVIAHNGADLSEFENRPPAEKIREKLGLPTGEKIVCYCGNTYPGRGIEILIEAAAEIKDALFLIVGGTHKDNAPLARAARSKGLGNFIMKNFVPHSDVPSYLLAADALVMPYTSEMTIKGGTKAAEFTSPLKLFEYMAAGRPLAAASLPTVREILTHGRDCILVPPGSAADFCEALRKCLNDQNFAQAIAQRAKEKSRSYTWEKRVEKILKGATSGHAAGGG